jgi:ComF family protein
MQTVYRFLNGLNYSLLPARCVLCENPGMPHLDLCEACFLDLPGKPSPLPCSHGSVHAGFFYTSPIDGMIHGFKFHEQLHVGRLLARLSLPGLMPERPEALLPIPLHVTRLRERGFNQALELARFWGGRLSVPVHGHILSRQRATQAQSRLNAAERAANVVGAFRAKGRVPGHVALVDDVYTTGATCRAAANALMAAGAHRVDVWCLARVS